MDEGGGCIGGGVRARPVKRDAIISDLLFGVHQSEYEAVNPINMTV